MTSTPEWALRFELIMGLRKGIKTCRGLRRQLTEIDEWLIAEKIVEQFRLSGYRIEHNGAVVDLTKRVYRQPE